MGKVIKITESQLGTVLKTVINEQYAYNSPYNPYNPNYNPPKAQQKPSFSGFGGGKFGGAGGGGEWGDNTNPTQPNKPQGKTNVPPIIVPPVQNKRQWRRNENFPLMPWDLSNKIAIIQRGMNLPPIQQKGYFGNITLNKIKQDMGIDVSKGIDEATYNKILSFYGIDNTGNKLPTARVKTEDDYLNPLNPIKPRTPQIQPTNQNLMTRR